MQMSKAVDANKVAEARLPELLQISALCEGEQYGVRGLPRHMRRRTRSHNGYRHAKRPRVAGSEDKRGEKQQPKKMNRKMRREELFRSYQGNPFDASTSSSTNIFLPTHVFHAKRMKMQVLSGFVLAEGQPGKGHGTRSFVHKLNTGCVVHDLSYWCSIELAFCEGLDGEAAVRQVVERSARGRHPLIRSGVATSNTPRGELIWAHYVYAREAVAMVNKLPEVDSTRTHVGRLGRIELRGPRSNDVLQKALASMNGGFSEYDIIPAGPMGLEGRAGCTVVASREAYDRLFKAICLVGGVLLCGQREWHWCQTLHGERFYPDDYEDGGCEGGGDDGDHQDQAAIPVRVWVRGKGVLEVGMVLMDGADKIVGIVTSAKPRMLSNKYCSIGRVHFQFLHDGAKEGGADKTKWRLSAQRPDRYPSSTASRKISVTVRPLAT
jgi:hypothetical protein